MLKSNIAEIRNSKGMTQAELAEKTGLHVFQISEYENNKTYPYPQTLWKIAKALNCKVDDLYSVEHD